MQEGSGESNNTDTAPSLPPRENTPSGAGPSLTRNQKRNQRKHSLRRMKSNNNASDQTPPPPPPLGVEDLKQLGVLYEREQFLKKKLLQGIVFEEVEAFMRNPKMIFNRRNTLMGIFYAKVMDFPPFRQQGKSFETAVENIIMRLPEISYKFELATGDPFRKRMVNVIVGNLMIMMRTKGERSYLDLLLAHHNGKNNNNNTSGEDYIDLSNPEGEKNFVRRKFLEVFSLILTEMEQDGDKGGGTGRARTRSGGSASGDEAGPAARTGSGTRASANSLFEHFVCAHTVGELPYVYRVLFSLQRAMMTHSLQKRSSEDLKKSKKLYHNTPRRSILALLKLTNPAKIVSGISSLIFAKPFGGRSQFQKIVEGSVDPGHCEQMLKEACVGVHRLVVKKCMEFMASWYCEDGTMSPEEYNSREKIIAILKDETKATKNSSGNVGPKLDPAAVDALTDEDCSRIHAILVHEHKRRDRVALVDVCGCEEITRFFEEFIPALQKPLKDMTEAGGLYALCKGLFDVWNDVVEIDSAVAKGKYPRDDPMVESRYNVAMSHVQLDIHTFLHNAITLDRGALQGIGQWMVNSWFTTDSQFDLARLTDPLGEEERAAMEKELDAVVYYYKHLKKKENAPELVHISKFYPQFRDMLMEEFSLGEEKRKGSVPQGPSGAVGRAGGGSSSGVDAHGPIRVTRRKSSVTLQQGRAFSLGTRQARGVLMNMEIVFSGDPSTLLRRQGFRRIPQDLNAGGIGKSAFIWVRYMPTCQDDDDSDGDGNNKSSDKSGGLKPITSLRISSKGDEEKQLRTRGYTKMVKDMNRRTLVGKNLYLWYKRGETGVRPIVDVRVVLHQSEDLTFVNGYERLPESTNKGNISGSKCHIYILREHQLQ
eukprot:Nk52_evm3s2449 gene=Nk52_evmTU3s2449